MKRILLMFPLLLLLFLALPVAAQEPVAPPATSDDSRRSGRGLADLAAASLPRPQAVHAPAAEFEGMTPGGAYYKIAVPDGWSGGPLAIWNHGFSLDDPGPAPDLGPLIDIQLSQGYAVAASSYRQKGWALFDTVQDLGQLYQKVVELAGPPSEVIVYGGSLGGIVTAQALEQAEIGNVVGAMPLCGAMAGSRNWDAALDLRLLYDVVSADVPAGRIPGGAEGLPAGSSYTYVQLGLAVNATTGILFPPALRTPAQRANLDQILSVAGIPESFLLTVIGYGVFALSDLVHDPAKLGGASAIGNENVVYGDAEIDAAISRVSPDPVANDYLARHFTPSGRVADIKIVQIHTDKDGLVIVENAGEYASVVPAANLTTAIAVEDEPTHCGFTEGEVVAAWESLRAWIAGLPQPTATSIQASCGAIVAGGLAAGPCRFDPDFVIPDLDGRIRPRTHYHTLALPLVQE